MLISDNLPSIARPFGVSLLSGGTDRPYFYGLATSLMSKGPTLDLIANKELDYPEFHGKPGVNFLDFGGILNSQVSFTRKLGRIIFYYSRLLRYAATAKPEVFHVLWNYRIQLLDRTLLMLYYRLLGKKVVHTAHNVNAGRRDGTDSWLNRLTLKTQYGLCDHIFVHTEKMKLELVEDFRVSPDKIKVIPFGINNSIPDSDITRAQARERLGIPEGKKSILFFGRIQPRKGLEFAVEAFQQISAGDDEYRLIIAGRPDKCDQYWTAIADSMREEVRSGKIIVRAENIPDEDAEIYFKAADLLVLPYREIFQSGVLFLGYNFGLPVVATDVGSLKDDILEGKTGFVCNPQDAKDLAKSLKMYFASDLFADLENHRQEIMKYAKERNSWDLVADMTMNVYAGLLSGSGPEKVGRSQGLRT